MVNQFNFVSGWVATTICTTEDIRKRVSIIKKMLLIAKV